MTTKSYSKHKEFKEYSSSGNVRGYPDEQFEILKNELIPKGSKLDSLPRGGGGAREYHYEYKEEKHPSGKYDRKDLHTVEEYTIPPKTTPKGSESSSYYYTREERELPAITSSSRYMREEREQPSITSGTRTYNYETSSSSTPGYSKIKSSKVTKDLSQNVEELDSLLDDLQKDQERQLYKSGYTSDTAESSSFDYTRGPPIKAPSSGYSTMKREERMESSSWGSSPPPVPRSTELRQEVYREEKTESRVVPSQISPAMPIAVPPTVCTNCHHHATGTGTLPRGSTPMNKVTTTVKTYTYEVPADQDPTTVPLPPVADHHHSYVSSTATTSENLRTTTNSQPQPAPVAAVPPSPGGCRYCSHCNSRVQEYTTRSHITSTDVTDHSNERVIYPAPANQTLVPPAAHPHPHPQPHSHPVEPLNGHGPYGPTTYKYSETSYSSQNTTERFPVSPPTTTTRHLTPSPAPFPRPTTPSPTNQQPPKKLDDLLADFPEAQRFPTQPDGVVRRKVEVSHETSSASNAKDSPKTGPIIATKNVAGPAVYYPPGHTPFAKKQEVTPVGGYSASAMQGGGAYASGRGMYEYESGARSKEKHSETKTAVPICLPLCCAMPCVLL